MRATGNSNRELRPGLGSPEPEAAPCVGASLCCSSAALLSTHSPHQQSSFCVFSSKATPGCKGRSETHKPACLCPQLTSVRRQAQALRRWPGAAGWAWSCVAGVWRMAALSPEAVPCGQPCHPWGGTLVKVGRGWVLTLWSSWAWLLAVAPGPRSTVSGPRYCLRDDGLMRLRSWREDSWGEGRKGGRHSRVLGVLRGCVAGILWLALEPARCFLSLGSRVASWSLSPAVEWRQAPPFLPWERGGSRAHRAWHRASILGDQGAQPLGSNV